MRIHGNYWGLLSINNNIHSAFNTNATHSACLITLYILHYRRGSCPILGRDQNNRENATDFYLLQLHCTILAVFHNMQPTSCLEYESARQGQPNSCTTSLHTIQSTCNFIHHAWAALTAPVRQAAELRATRGRKTNVSNRNSSNTHIMC